MTVADLIRADHREFERLFSELSDAERRPLVAPALVALLAAHARAEESEVYPVLRERTDKSEKVEHSQEEHAEADQLASQLADSSLASEQFTSTLNDLVKSVRHHIEEEEETVLPGLDELDDATQQQLAMGFLRVRAEHLTAGATQLTREELERQAQNEGISGTSSMTKDQLEREVRS